MASREFWVARARRLIVRRNLAAWLDLLLTALPFIAGAFAAAILLLRTFEITLTAAWWAFAATLAITAVASWFAARRRFVGTKEALAQLDAVGGLHNRLTAAQSGIGDWPAPQPLRDATRWRWERLLVPPALAAILLAGAAWLPVSHAKARPRVTEQPLAWSQLDSWVQALEESKLVEEAALEELREQLDQLRQQPPEDWYKQSSLEAGDTLRDRTEQALRSLQQQLDKADESLAAASEANDKTAPSQLQAMNESLQQAAQAMEMGSLPLNKELLEKLKNFDAAKAKQLNPSELSQMREKVQSGAKVAEQAVNPGANVKKALAESGQGKEHGPGEGGEGGGGGPAPLALNDDATNLRTKEMETITNEDGSQALPGDLVGVQKAGEHDVEKIDRVPQVAGGAIGTTGEGGDAVRRETFTPREREVLQRFFK